jgi:hypothetical protein
MPVLPKKKRKPEMRLYSTGLSKYRIMGFSQNQGITGRRIFRGYLVLCLLKGGGTALMELGVGKMLR